MSDALFDACGQGMLWGPTRESGRKVRERPVHDPEGEEDCIRGQSRPATKDGLHAHRTWHLRALERMAMSHQTRTGRNKHGASLGSLAHLVHDDRFPPRQTATERGGDEASTGD